MCIAVSTSFKSLFMFVCCPFELTQRSNASGSAWGQVWLWRIKHSQTVWQEQQWNALASCSAVVLVTLFVVVTFKNAHSKFYIFFNRLINSIFHWWSAVSFVTYYFFLFLKLPLIIFYFNLIIFQYWFIQTSRL